jgi:hypothetical protein
MAKSKISEDEKRLESAKMAYEDILNTFKKYDNLKDHRGKSLIFIGIVDLPNLEKMAERHLLGLNLRKLGFSVNPEDFINSDYVRFGNNRIFSWYGEKYNRKISWSDDDRQPNNEYLFSIAIPNGAFIFGNHYPEETFKNFFNALLAYKPDFKDTKNSCLYWRITNPLAPKVFDEFQNILYTYKEADIELSKAQRIKELEEELELLKKS